LPSVKIDVYATDAPINPQIDFTLQPNYQQGEYYNQPMPIPQTPIENQVPVFNPVVPYPEGLSYPIVQNNLPPEGNISPVQPVYNPPTGYNGGEGNYPTKGEGNTQGYNGGEGNYPQGGEGYSSQQGQIYNSQGGQGYYSQEGQGYNSGVGGYNSQQGNNNFPQQPPYNPPQGLQQPPYPNQQPVVPVQQPIVPVQQPYGPPPTGEQKPMTLMDMIVSK
jgi:hypothetical protein